jgi:hypothetical protein
VPTLLAALTIILAAGSEADLPVILDVAVPPRVRVGEVAPIRLAYRAPLANVVTLVEAIEDLDGPSWARASREQAIAVTARASGSLVVSVGFATPGLKRVTLTLVTNQGERSGAAVVEVEVLPTAVEKRWPQADNISR